MSSLNDVTTDFVTTNNSLASEGAVIMSDTNRIKLSAAKETTWATTPSANGKVIRHTGESLKMNTATTRSMEIRSDRQIPKIIRTSINASGDVGFEYSYGSWDDYMEAALFSAGWSTAVTLTASTISAAAADNSFNDSGNGMGVFAVGQYIRSSSFSTSGNNGIAKIVSVAAGKIVVSGLTLTNEAAGSARTIYMGAQITNGTTLSSFSFEKSFTDLTNIFAALRGMIPSNFGMNITADGIVTGSSSWMGKSETNETATIFTGYTAANDNQVMNAIDDIYAILEGGTATEVNSLNWTLGNNLRNRLVVANLGPKSIGAGHIDLGGAVQMYFATHAIMAKYLAFTETSLTIVMRDSDLNYYVIEFPSIRFTDGKRVAGGQDQDIIADMTFAAARKTSEDVTIRITRIPHL